MSYCSDYHLSIVTPPAIEPLTLEQALVQCHANSGVEDDWFYETITAVREDAEKYQRRAYIEQTLRVTYDKLPSVMPILLPRPPLIEIESFSFFDVDDTESAVNLSDLLIDTYSQPGRVTFVNGYSMPSITLREINSIIIQYKAGYGDAADDVPRNIRQAMLLHLGYLYDCRSGEPEPITEEYHCLLNRQKIYL